MQKTCSRCKNLKDLTAFYRCQATADGRQYKCKTCDHAASRQRYAKNPAPAKDQAARWFIENRDRALENARNWREANPQHHRKNVRRWHRENRGRHNEHTARYEARKRQACPPWAKGCPKVAAVYQAATDLKRVFGWDLHVDHIIPLTPADENAPQGLHVVSNLRIIPASLNISKGNRLPSTIL